MMGASTDEIATQAGKKCTQSAKYYTQTDKILGVTKSHDMLSQSTTSVNRDKSRKANILQMPSIHLKSFLTVV